MLFLSNFSWRVLLSFVLAAIVATGAQADDVAKYLERHGLTGLLALHLEEELDAADGTDRREIAVRLAEIYATLLEESDDLTARVDLEERSRELLTIVPKEQADELRLALLRGAYVAAERIAENHRLRLSDPESVDRAKTILSETLPQFSVLREQLGSRVEALERRRSRANPTDTARLSQEIQIARDLYQRCIFLNAWALYYQSWLRDRPESARVAKKLFAEILDPEVARFSIRDVSVDLLEAEAYARTVLGMALSAALTEPIDRALQWLGVLENDTTFEQIREQVPAWRMAILLEEEEFEQVRLILSAQRDADAPARRGPDRTPLVWVRLAAVYALESADRDRAAAELAADAIAELAAQGELNQVLDLAERYGVESLGAEGFTVLYVRGATAYQDARELHGDDLPTAQSDVTALYARAAGLFESAIAQPDASRFPDAAAGAGVLIGWCHYFQSHFMEAHRAFLAASKHLGLIEAEEALWMAIISLDHVVKDDSSSPRADELEGLIASFIARFPASEYTPKLILRQTDIGISEPSIELVEELQRIPPNSEDYDAAQRKSAQMLYQLYKDASDEIERADFGNRYIATALPLWSRRTIEQITSDSAKLEVFVVRGRRILDVALSSIIERLAAARDVLNRFDELAAEGTIDLTEIEQELDYRRMQAAMASGAMDQSRLFADRIWEQDSANDWARAAMRTMLRQSVTRWHAAGQADDVRDLLDRVLVYGKRVLREFDGDENALEDVNVIAYFSTVGEAALAVWERSGDPEQGRFGLELFKKLLDARPANRAFLHAVGTLGAAFGEYDIALDAWRKLSAGTEQSDERWFEARYNLIAAIFHIDPDRARRVYDQHAILNPQLGPADWKKRFELLDQEIDVAIAARGAGNSEEGGER